MLATVPGVAYTDAPKWVATWEDTGLIAWHDRDGDGVITHAPGKVFAAKKPVFAADPETNEPVRGIHDERTLDLEASGGLVEGKNEFYVDRDIMVLANPEIAGLPEWVIALVAAGGLAAALSTAAGLLMVISSAVSHDLIKKSFNPGISEKGELRTARIAAACAVVCAGLLGIYPPDYVAAVVAFAFGLAASSFFPAILLGIFWKRMNAAGAVSGMICGIGFTAAYIIWFKFIPGTSNSDWFLGISPEGIGSIGMLINFAVAIPVALLTSPPSAEVQELVERIRVPAEE
jgi:cation/acetate symporter